MTNFDTSSQLSLESALNVLGSDEELKPMIDALRSCGVNSVCAAKRLGISHTSRKARRKWAAIWNRIPQSLTEVARDTLSDLVTIPRLPPSQPTIIVNESKPEPIPKGTVRRLKEKMKDDIHSDSNSDFYFDETGMLNINIGVPIDMATKESKAAKAARLRKQKLAKERKLKLEREAKAAKAAKLKEKLNGTSASTPSTNATSESGNSGFHDQHLNDISPSTNNLSLGDARTTEPYIKDTSLQFPQSVDLLVCRNRVKPTGLDHSIVNGYWQRTIAPRMVTSMQLALSYKSDAITESVLSKYLTVVSEAYQFLLSQHVLINLFQGLPRATSLQRRYSNLYSPEVRSAHVKLSNALSTFFLPMKVIQLIKQQCKVHVIDETPDSPLLFNGFSTRKDSAADLVIELEAYITELNSLPDHVMVNNAVHPENRRRSEFAEFVSLDSYLSRDPDEYLNDVPTTSYNEDALDVWANMPLLATDGTSAVKRHEAAETEMITQCNFGDILDGASNALIPQYSTTSSVFEPGFLEPLMNISPNRNIFYYVNDLGIIKPFNVVTADAIVGGVLARNMNWVYTNNAQLRIVPGGANYTQTSISHKGQDAKAFMDMLYQL